MFKKFNIFKGLEINEENCSILFSEAYESLLEICHAIAALKGYKIYNHVCVAGFLSEMLKEVQIAEKFDSYRSVRNRIVYYGRQVDEDYAKSSIADILGVISKLKKKYLDDVKHKGQKR